MNQTKKFNISNPAVVRSNTVKNENDDNIDLVRNRLSSLLFQEKALREKQGVVQVGKTASPPRKKVVPPPRRSAPTPHIKNLKIITKFTPGAVYEELNVLEHRIVEDLITKLDYQYGNLESNYSNLIEQFLRSSAKSLNSSYAWAFVTSPESIYHGEYTTNLVNARQELNRAFDMQIDGVNATSISRSVSKSAKVRYVSVYSADTVSDVTKDNISYVLSLSHKTESFRKLLAGVYSPLDSKFGSRSNVTKDFANVNMFNDELKLAGLRLDCFDGNPLLQEGDACLSCFLVSVPLFENESGQKADEQKCLFCFAFPESYFDEDKSVSRGPNVNLNSGDCPFSRKEEIFDYLRKFRSVLIQSLKMLGEQSLRYFSGESSRLVNAMLKSSLSDARLLSSRIDNDKFAKSGGDKGIALSSPFLTMIKKLQSVEFSSFLGIECIRVLLDGRLYSIISNEMVEGRISGNSRVDASNYYYISSNDGLSNHFISVGGAKHLRSWIVKESKEFSGLVLPSITWLEVYCRLRSSGKIIGDEVDELHPIQIVSCSSSKLKFQSNSKGSIDDRENAFMNANKTFGTDSMNADETLSPNDDICSDIYNCVKSFSSKGTSFAVIPLRCTLSAPVDLSDDSGTMLLLLVNRKNELNSHGYLQFPLVPGILSSMDEQRSSLTQTITESDVLRIFNSEFYSNFASAFQTVVSIQSSQVSLLKRDRLDMRLYSIAKLVDNRIRTKTIARIFHSWFRSLDERKKMRAQFRESELLIPFTNRMFDLISVKADKSVDFENAVMEGISSLGYNSHPVISKITHCLADFINTLMSSSNVRVRVFIPNTSLAMERRISNEKIVQWFKKGKLNLDSTYLENCSFFVADEDLKNLELANCVVCTLKVFESMNSSGNRLEIFDIINTVRKADIVAAVIVESDTPIGKDDLYCLQKLSSLSSKFCSYVASSNYAQSEEAKRIGCVGVSILRNLIPAIIGSCSDCSRQSKYSNGEDLWENVLFAISKVVKFLFGAKEVKLTIAKDFLESFEKLPKIEELGNSLASSVLKDVSLFQQWSISQSEGLLFSVTSEDKKIADSTRILSIINDLQSTVAEMVTLQENHTSDLKDGYTIKCKLNSCGSLVLDDEASINSKNMGEVVIYGSTTDLKSVDMGRKEILETIFYSLITCLRIRSHLMMVDHGYLSFAQKVTSMEISMKEASEQIKAEGKATGIWREKLTAILPVMVFLRKLGDASTVESVVAIVEGTLPSILGCDTVRLFVNESWQKGEAVAKPSFLMLSQSGVKEKVDYDALMQVACFPSATQSKIILSRENGVQKVSLSHPSVFGLLHVSPTRVVDVWEGGLLDLLQDSLSGSILLALNRIDTVRTIGLFKQTVKDYSDLKTINSDACGELVSLKDENSLLREKLATMSRELENLKNSVVQNEEKHKLELSNVTNLCDSKIKFEKVVQMKLQEDIESNIEENKRIRNDITLESTLNDNVLDLLRSYMLDNRSHSQKDIMAWMQDVLMSEIPSKLALSSLFPIDSKVILIKQKSDGTLSVCDSGDSTGKVLVSPIRGLMPSVAECIRTRVGNVEFESVWEDSNSSDVISSAFSNVVRVLCLPHPNLNPLVESNFACFVFIKRGKLNDGPPNVFSFAERKFLECLVTLVCSSALHAGGGRSAAEIKEIEDRFQKMSEYVVKVNKCAEAVNGVWLSGVKSRVGLENLLKDKLDNLLVTSFSSKDSSLQDLRSLAVSFYLPNMNASNSHQQISVFEELWESSLVIGGLLYELTEKQLNLVKQGCVVKRGTSILIPLKGQTGVVIALIKVERILSVSDGTNENDKLILQKKALTYLLFTDEEEEILKLFGVMLSPIIDNNKTVWDAFESIKEASAALVKLQESKTQIEDQVAIEMASRIEIEESMKGSLGLLTDSLTLYRNSEDVFPLLKSVRKTIVDVLSSDECFILSPPSITLYKTLPDVNLSDAVGGQTFFDSEDSNMHHVFEEASKYVSLKNFTPRPVVNDEIITQAESENLMKLYTWDDLDSEKKGTTKFSHSSMPVSLENGDVERISLLNCQLLSYVSRNSLVSDFAQEANSVVDSWKSWSIRAVQDRLFRMKITGIRDDSKKSNQFLSGVSNAPLSGTSEADCGLHILVVPFMLVGGAQGVITVMRRNAPFSNIDRDCCHWLSRVMVYAHFVRQVSCGGSPFAGNVFSRRYGEVMKHQPIVNEGSDEMAIKTLLQVTSNISLRYQRELQSLHDDLQSFYENSSLENAFSYSDEILSQPPRSSDDFFSILRDDFLKEINGYEVIYRCLCSLFGTKFVGTNSSTSSNFTISIYAEDDESVQAGLRAALSGSTGLSDFAVFFPYTNSKVKSIVRYGDKTLDDGTVKSEVTAIKSANGQILFYSVHPVVSLPEKQHPNIHAPVISKENPGPIAIYALIRHKGYALAYAKIEVKQCNPAQPLAEPGGLLKIRFSFLLALLENSIVERDRMRKMFNCLSFINNERLTDRNDFEKKSIDVKVHCDNEMTKLKTEYKLNYRTMSEQFHTLEILMSSAFRFGFTNFMGSLSNSSSEGVVIKSRNIFHGYFREALLKYLKLHTYKHAVSLDENADEDRDKIVLRWVKLIISKFSRVLSESPPPLDLKTQLGDVCEDVKLTHFHEIKVSTISYGPTDINENFEALLSAQEVLQKPTVKPVKINVATLEESEEDEPIEMNKESGRSNVGFEEFSFGRASSVQLISEKDGKVSQKYSFEEHVAASENIAKSSSRKLNAFKRKEARKEILHALINEKKLVYMLDENVKTEISSNSQGFQLPLATNPSMISVEDLQFRVKFVHSNEYTSGTILIPLIVVKGRSKEKDQHNLLVLTVLPHIISESNDDKICAMSESELLCWCMLSQQLQTFLMLSEASIYQFYDQRKLVLSTLRHVTNSFNSRSRKMKLSRAFEVLRGHVRECSLKHDLARAPSIEQVQFLENSLADWRDLAKGLNSGACSAAVQFANMDVSDDTVINGVSTLWSLCCSTLMSVLSSHVSLKGCGLLILDKNLELTELFVRDISSMPGPKSVDINNLDYAIGVIESRRPADIGSTALSLASSILSNAEDDKAKHQMHSQRIWRFSKANQQFHPRQSDEMGYEHEPKETALLSKREQLWLVPVKTSTNVLCIVRINVEMPENMDVIADRKFMTDRKEGLTEEMSSEIRLQAALSCLTSFSDLFGPLVFASRQFGSYKLNINGMHKLLEQARIKQNLSTTELTMSLKKMSLMSTIVQICSEFAIEGFNLKEIMHKITKSSHNNLDTSTMSIKSELETFDLSKNVEYAGMDEREVLKESKRIFSEIISEKIKRVLPGVMDLSIDLCGDLFPDKGRSAGYVLEEKIVDLDGKVIGNLSLTFKQQIKDLHSARSDLSYIDQEIAAVCSIVSSLCSTILPTVILTFCRELEAKYKLTASVNHLQILDRVVEQQHKDISDYVFKDQVLSLSNRFYNALSSILTFCSNATASFETKEPDTVKDDDDAHIWQEALLEEGYMAGVQQEVDSLIDQECFSDVKNLEEKDLWCKAPKVLECFSYIAEQVCSTVCAAQGNRNYLAHSRLRSVKFKNIMQIRFGILLPNSSENNSISNSDIISNVKAPIDVETIKGLYDFMWTSYQLSDGSSAIARVNDDKIGGGLLSAVVAENIASVCVANGTLSIIEVGRRDEENVVNLSGMGNFRTAVNKNEWDCEGIRVMTYPLSFCYPAGAYSSPSGCFPSIGVLQIVVDKASIIGLRKKDTAFDTSILTSSEVVFDERYQNQLESFLADVAQALANSLYGLRRLYDMSLQSADFTRKTHISDISVRKHVFRERLWRAVIAVGVQLHNSCVALCSSDSVDSGISDNSVPLYSNIITMVEGIIMSLSTLTPECGSSEICKVSGRTLAEILNSLPIRVSLRIVNFGGVSTEHTNIEIPIVGFDEIGVNERISIGGFRSWARSIRDFDGHDVLAYVNIPVSEEGVFEEKERVFVHVAVVGKNNDVRPVVRSTLANDVVSYLAEVMNSVVVYSRDRLERMRHLRRSVAEQNKLRIDCDEWKDNYSNLQRDKIRLESEFHVTKRHADTLANQMSDIFLSRCVPLLQSVTELVKNSSVASSNSESYAWKSVENAIDSTLKLTVDSLHHSLLSATYLADAETKGKLGWFHVSVFATNTDVNLSPSPKDFNSKFSCKLYDAYRETPMDVSVSVLGEQDYILSPTKGVSNSSRFVKSAGLSGLLQCMRFGHIVEMECESVSRDIDLIGVSESNLTTISSCSSSHLSGANWTVLWVPLNLMESKQEPSQYSGVIRLILPRNFGHTNRAVAKESGSPTQSPQRSQSRSPDRSQKEENAESLSFKFASYPSSISIFNSPSSIVKFLQVITSTSGYLLRMILHHLFKVSQPSQESILASAECEKQLARMRKLHRLILRETLGFLDPPPLFNNASESVFKIGFPHHVSLPPLLTYQDVCLKALSMTKSLMETEGQAITLQNIFGKKDISPEYHLIYSGTSLRWSNIDQGCLSVLPKGTAQSLSEYVITNGKTMYVENPLSETRYSAVFDGTISTVDDYDMEVTMSSKSKKKAAPLSLLIVPIRARNGAVNGVLSMVKRKKSDSKSESTAFSKEDVIVAESLAGSLSLSLYWCEGTSALHNQIVKTCKRIEGLEFAVNTLKIPEGKL